MVDRRILAIDVGRGTQDVLLYDPEVPVENSVKLVLPSPTVVVGNAVREAARSGRPIHLEGACMGGGGSVLAVREAALAAGVRVTATPEAALTVHDDPARVAAFGVEVADEAPADAVTVRTGDYMVHELQTALALFGVPYPERVAIAVQDHGFSPKVSNRIFRFSVFQKLLEEGDWDLFALAPDPPYPPMSRMQAVLSGAPDALVTDTGPVAAIGALLDPWVAAQANADGVTLVNVGNGHTLAFTLRGTEVLGLFEHHTSSLDPARLNRFLGKLQDGTLTNEEVFEDGGHGAAVREAIGETPIAVTGPNRARLLPDAYQAAPFGDMMLTGCFGLLEVWRRRRGKI
ncbi:pyruvate formate lyase-activating protein [Methanofollis aquaemaris]|uniref:Pyruvate formate lyase-activating protein n=1 Tax=Methanofollis aquaemaris TaxID=126734 RepID=A0A8A3S4M6_9EURY|nr:DUF1786 domain-containing protein [Methanofollis aquaemaris]QSZ66873.1 pyruvate formate lyase-activating protein [Methanofollis aquaemaris]